jgi:hypothetical protein
MAWNIIPAFILDQVFGYQSANKLRENSLALASARLTHDLGGSRSISLPLVASAQDAVNYVDLELDGTLLGGLTIQARVECRTMNAATSITPKVRNLTDASDAGLGTASTSTTYAGVGGTQTFTVALAAGVRKYRLQGTPSNTTHPTFVQGYLEIFATS